MMTTHNINFEDMQLAINDQHSQNGLHSQNGQHSQNGLHSQHSQYVKTLIINTLEAHQQSCLISGTLSIEMEIEVLNAHLKNNKDVQIIIYGMNSSDNTCIKKYEQLIKLGFYNVYIYGGGLFEWLLLQDIYGTELFPTTVTKVDILKYKGRRILNMKMLEHY